MTAPEPPRPALDHARQRASQGDAAGAAQHARQAAEQAAHDGDRRGLAESRVLLAQQLFALGRADEALHQAEAARAVWQQLDEPDRECEVLVQMAMALSEQGTPAAALAMAEGALALVHAHALEGRLPRVLALLGGLQGQLGEWAESETLLLQSLSLARDRHDTAQVVSTMNALLMHLGHAQDAQHRAGQQAEARATQQRLLHHARRALTLSAEEPQPFRRTVLRGNVGTALLVCGQPDEAATLLADTLQQALQHGYRAVVLRTRLRLARAWLQQGLADAATQQAQLLQAELDAEDHPQARQELQDLRDALALHPPQVLAGTRWA
jgi:tetratricopeptide (TPR) repeat protein